MLFWFYAGIGVYLITILAPSTLRLQALGLFRYMGSRDSEPDPGVVQKRGLRAAENMKESFPIFLALAVLALTLSEVDQSLAVTGAAIFVVARLVYTGLCLAGVPVVRSFAFMASVIGLGMIGFAIV